MSAAVLDMPTAPTTRPSTPPAGVDRIVLTGFMGSGKTTIGTLLAEQLGWGFLDLDHEIERREARTVPQIFAENGEPAFRRAEALTLASLLGQRRVVIALGGGAPEELGNRLLLEQTPRTAVIYLAAAFEVLVERCRVQALNPAATARPVLADVATAAERFTRRKPHYERIAAHIVQTEANTAMETVQVVLRKLKTGRS